MRWATMRRAVLLGCVGTVALVGCEVAVTPMEPGRMDLSVNDLGGNAFGVIADPVGCAIAVGSMSDGYGDWPGFWWSADCAKFVGRAPRPGEPGPYRDDRSVVKDVVARPGGGFVAVGHTDVPGDSLVATIDVHTSADGVTWSQAPAPERRQDNGYQHADNLLVTNDGTYLLVGGEDGRAVVWRSTDLATWTTIDLPDRTGDPAPKWSDTLGVAQAADGRIVVVGSSSSTDYSTDDDAAAWASTDDGRTWTSAPPEGVFAPTVGSIETMWPVVARSDGTFLAAGRVADQQVLWASTDGLTWSPAGTAPGPINKLVVDGDRILATGSVHTDSGWKGDLWDSVDGGQTWAEHRLAGVGFATDVAPIADGYVVVGGNGYGKAWSATLDLD